MRKYYIDNLRWLTVLLLFPYHTFMIYNGFESFYIKGDYSPILNCFLVFTYPWFMPLLFTVAGMSTCYALQKRTMKAYVKERLLKLFVPLVSGLLLLIPVQTYYAEKFHNGYAGSYFEQYSLFFTKPTDLTGYRGGFTPGQLWFIFYLFVISLAALPVILLYKQWGERLPVEKFTLPMLLPLFLVVFVFSLILDIGGKSLGEYFALFMLGYLILADDTVQDRLEKNRWCLIGAALLFLTGNVAYQLLVGIPAGLFYDISIRFVAWVSILGILGMGKHFLNFSNRVTDYFSKASFPIYIFHQSWIILIAYYTFLLTDSIILQVTVILSVSFLMTLGTYELCKRTSATRFLFGIKKRA